MMQCNFAGKSFRVQTPECPCNFEIIARTVEGLGKASILENVYRAPKVHDARYDVLVTGAAASWPAQCNRISHFCVAVVSQVFELQFAQCAKILGLGGVIVYFLDVGRPTCSGHSYSC